MKEFLIQKNDAGQRLNKFLQKAVPGLSGGMMHKYCRTKRIKLNHARTDPSVKLTEGDILSLYINDSFFAEKPKNHAFVPIASPKLNIVYEDDNLILLDKRPGIVVHEDTQGSITLVDHLLSYLYQSGQWHPEEEQSFTPALCNRIDRNTGGIVIASKNAQTLRVLNEKIKARELTKKYLCVVCGTPCPKTGTIDAFLRKDEALGRMTVHRTRVQGAKTAITHYRTLAQTGNLSLVECELITGRTHQIRAHMASIGCPLLGDGKYGTNAQNKPYKEKSQLLYSYLLSFSFTSDAEHLAYLQNQTFFVSDVPFLKTYFPNISLASLQTKKRA